jgi:hypothetical protein
MKYLLLFRGNNGYVNGPQFYVYTYMAFLVTYIAKQSDFFCFCF